MKKKEKEKKWIGAKTGIVCSSSESTLSSLPMGCYDKFTGRSGKTLAKFGEGSSVMADGLCIGYPRLVGRRKAENSNMQQLFGTTLYRAERASLCKS